MCFKLSVGDIKIKITFLSKMGITGSLLEIQNCWSLFLNQNLHFKK